MLIFQQLQLDILGSLISYSLVYLLFYSLPFGNFLHFFAALIIIVSHMVLEIFLVEGDRNPT